MNLTSVTLGGLVQLSDYRLLFFFLCLGAFVFVLFSDSLVVYLVVSRRILHRPIGGGLTRVSRAACLCQAFVVYFLGGSSFMQLAAMSFDRYVSICRPLRYAALVSPSAGARSCCSAGCCPPSCLSCGGGAALLSEVYGLICAMTTVFLPAAFVFFSYSKILTVCLHRSRSFSSKALHTCLPHLLVFLNYSVSAAFELLHRRLHNASDPAASVAISVMVVMVPTVLNPVVYGLKVEEIFTQVKKLLRCQTHG
ncbi:hypothetical protein PAMA_003633 [Pampus argenteus]